MIDLSPKCVKKISFEIPGDPQQKRSSQPNAIKRGDKWVGKSRPHKKNAPVAANIMECAYLAGWPRNAVPHAGPVMLKVQAFFKIRSADSNSWKKELYETEKIFHTSTPDIDRIINQVQDSLKGIIWGDDKQICKYIDPQKLYGPRPRTEVTIWLISNQMPGSNAEYKQMITSAKINNGGTT